MAEAQAPAEGKEEESRPVVTQVVEVVEDPAAPSSAHETEEVQKEEVEEPVEENLEPEKTEQADIPERRKEMVDELYAPDRQSRVMPEISMHKHSSTKPIVVWAVITIVVALLSGGILFAVTKKASFSSLLARPTPTPTPSPMPIVTPTPEEIDKTALSLQVLNGGGTPGAAAKMKSLLEEKGYTVKATGNTEEYTYDTTEIHVKASASAALVHLEVDLKDSYVLGTTAADLADESSFDVQVIVGKE